MHLSHDQAEVFKDILGAMLGYLTRVTGAWSKHASIATSCTTTSSGRRLRHKTHIRGSLSVVRAWRRAEAEVVIRFEIVFLPAMSLTVLLRRIPIGETWRLRLASSSHAV